MIVEKCNRRRACLCTAVGLIDRFARCFRDSRSEELIEHTVATTVGQRIFGIALGYEDVVDHDELRHAPIMAVLAGKLVARRKNCAPVAGRRPAGWKDQGTAPKSPYRCCRDRGAIGALGWSERDRGFESCFLQRRVHCEPSFRGAFEIFRREDPVRARSEISWAFRR